MRQKRQQVNKKGKGRKLPYLEMKHPNEQALDIQIKSILQQVRQYTWLERITIYIKKVFNIQKTNNKGPERGFFVSESNNQQTLNTYYEQYK